MHITKTYMWRYRKGMRAAVYLRQSLDPSGNMLAITRQRGPCLELCAQRGWEAVEYVDNDRSATRGRRPSYEQMLVDIEAGKIDAIVAWDLDRLYRRPVELEHLIDLADTRRLLLATITGDADLSTDNGRLYARIKGAVAKAEGERKAARQKASHRQRAESGKPWGNRRLFGYTEDMQLHPVEAPAVREAFDRFLAGSSLGSIAAAWNGAGLTTTVGNRWRGPGVSLFMTNPKLAGLISYNGEIVGPGTWPAIVDEETWKAARAIRSDPQRNPRPGSRARKYLLTGIALCGGKCAGGARLSSGKTAWGKTIYRCPVCHGIGRDQEALDDHITALVVARLSQPDAKDLLVDEDREGISELREQAAKVQGKLEALAVAFEDDEDDDEVAAVQYRRSVKRLTAKLREFETRMADAQRARIFEGVIGAEDVRAAFEAAGLDRQREIVSALLTVVVRPTVQGAGFRPDDIGAEWRIPGR